MTRIKNYFTSYTAISVLVMGLFFTAVFAFKPGENTKQIMTIDVVELTTKRCMGIYIFRDGKLVENVFPGTAQTVDEIIKRGEIFNATLQKYYNEGWTITSVNSIETANFTTIPYTRYTLEK
jgi:hypothetical protein